MTLQVRLILITFVILLIALFTTTIIYYSLTGQLLSKYQSQSILNSTNDFVFSFQSTIQQTDEDFGKLTPKLSDFSNINLDSTNIDFLFTLVNDSLISNSEFKFKSNSFLSVRSRSFTQLFADNPNIVLRYTKLEDGRTVYYGCLISPQFLDEISKKIRADVALVINDSPVELSNAGKNQIYLLSVINAINNLKYKNNYDLYNEVLDNADFEAAKITPHQILTPGGKMHFVLFNTYAEGAGFRETLKNVMIIIVIAGTALTFIVVLLFTTKLRKQIGLLNEAAEITKKGNLEHRVQIISKDELGKLGEAFNGMLDELNKKEKAEKEYTEFITLINQSPTLKEVSEAALANIIKSTNLTFGVLYIVEEKNLRLISSFGIGKNLVKPTQDPDLYSNAIDKKEVVEFNFHENFPEIKTGLASIKIKYLLIYPIIYNKETIAILELASESEPSGEIKKYISTVQEQLAIGLINSRSLEQLENFVNELRRLNEEYQRQNKQIIQQNDQLKELHKQINEKAIELEKQRSKAVELTKVKSQFLASMSHELRTPLISILGLTELILRDEMTPVKSKDRLGIVHRNGKKLLGMITNILEFSKFESGKIEVKKDNFLLNDLIEEIEPNIRQLAGDKKIRFIIESQPGKNLLLNTDKSKLEQILNNLLINAVKFTDSGEVKLIIKLEEDYQLKFSVRDTGIGISEENQQIIFSEFRQIDGSTSRKYGGAGLGLTITKRYIELMGGTLSLKSELNKGSEFWFTLGDIVLDVLEMPAQKFLKIEETLDENISKKALLVSCKNIETRKLIADYLQSYDYEIIPCSSEEDGINIPETVSPDAIIICSEDHQKNIWQIIYKIKSNPSTNDVVTVIVSTLENEKVGWLPPIYDFINKPISVGSIRKVVHNIELFAESKVSRIYYTSYNKEEYSILAIPENLSDDIIYYDNLETLTSNLNRDSLQVVFIDVKSLGTKALRFLSFINEYKLNRNVYTVFCLSQDFTESEIQMLNSEMQNLTLKSKNHPLDLLKDLKDRLKIDEETINKKQNLIEENVDDELIRLSGIHIPQSKHTILIVDDDADTLFTIGEIVKEMQYDTIYAHNGSECLLMLNHIIPDLILLDIMMPQMDGFETIKRIRSDDRFVAMPVIALTAYAMLDNKNVVTKNGFNDIVTKPVNSSLLASKINYYLKPKVGVV